MVAIIQGDALDALAAREIGVLGHQVNMLGTMGGGIAWQIANRWPTVIGPYKLALRHGTLKLGIAQFVRVGEGQWIANLAGQNAHGVSRVTNYVALAAALAQYAEFLRDNDLRGGLPFGLGCGIGGGDWHVVSSLIEDAFVDVPMTIFRRDE